MFTSQRGLNDRQREAATFGDGPLRVMAGPGTGKTTTLTARVDYLLGRGVAPERIDTIADFEGAARHGTKTDGNYAGASAAVLAELAQLIVDGKLEIPIADTYPLDQVREAYRELEQRHTLGKIVLLP